MIVDTYQICYNSTKYILPVLPLLQVNIPFLSFIGASNYAAADTIVSVAH